MQNLDGIPERRLFSAAIICYYGIFCVGILERRLFYVMALEIVVWESLQENIELRLYQ